MRDRIYDQELMRLLTNRTVRPLLAALSLTLLLLAPEAAKAQAADLILINGKVLTVDASDSVAQALAIREGKIIAVGSNDAIRKLAIKTTRTIDLHGRTATPGLIDTHCHFEEAAALYDIELGDPSIKTINDVVELVRRKAATLKPGEWVRGAGWDEGKFSERRYVYASDLDQVSPNNPVWLEHTTGHYGVANSYALSLAGVTKTTPNPTAGTIDHDSAGAPTGVLKEGAQALVTRLVPPYSREQQKNGLLKIIADFNKEGMTGVKNPGMGPEEWSLYEELLKENKLTVRLFALWSAGRTMETAWQALKYVEAQPKPPQSLGGQLLSGGVKIFMDGSGGARTAWMYQPWNKNSTAIDSGNLGYPTTDPEVYRQMVRMFHQAGIHVSTHAIGDHAIDWVVDTYAQVLKDKPTPGLRHGIIHANTPTDHAIDTMAQLQKQYDAGYPESQPTFIWWIGDNYAGNLGPQRALRLEPFATYLAKGVKWGGGSDYPVTPYPARYGLWSSIERKTLKGTYGEQPFGTAESIDIHAALRSYTIWAAHQIFLEDKVGSLEPGKDADIAVWDQDLYTMPSAAIKDLKCELTLFKGRIVHRAEGSAITIH